MVEKSKENMKALMGYEDTWGRLPRGWNGYLRCLGLTPNERDVVLTLIPYRVSESSVVKPGIRQLVKEAKMARPHLEAALKSLHAKSLVLITPGQGKTTNQYNLAPLIYEIRQLHEKERTGGVVEPPKKSRRGKSFLKKEGTAKKGNATPLPRRLETIEDLLPGFLEETIVVEVPDPPPPKKKLAPGTKRLEDLTQEEIDRIPPEEFMELFQNGQQ